MTKNNKWEKFSEEQPEADDAAEAGAPGLEEESREDLVEELNEVEQQINEYKDQALRAQAELENVRRRSEKEVENAFKYATKKLLQELIPAVDGLVRGLETEASDNPQAIALREGMELTLKMLEQTLEKNGVVVIEPVQGDAFDPQKHEAMSMIDSPDVDSQCVVNVLQRGYELNGRVIKAAMVVVAK